MHSPINKYKSRFLLEIRFIVSGNRCGRVKFATKVSLGLHLLLIVGCRSAFLTCALWTSDMIFLFLRTDHVEGSNSFDNVWKKFMLKFIDINVIT